MALQVLPFDLLLNSYATGNLWILVQVDLLQSKHGKYNARIILKKNTTVSHG